MVFIGFTKQDAALHFHKAGKSHQIDDETRNKVVAGELKPSPVGGEGFIVGREWKEEVGVCLPLQMPD